MSGSAQPSLAMSNSRLRRVIALFGTPAAWIAQMSISNSVASYTCFPHQMPLAEPLWAGTKACLLLCSFIAIMAGLCSGYIAFISWKDTKHKASGNGAAGFLSMLGLMSSGIFLTAILLAACATLFISPCRSWFGL